MGESKRRRENARKIGRGLVISPPIDTRNGDLSIINSSLNPERLRYSLLFFDKLALPYNNIVYIGDNAETNFLMSASILLRPVSNPEGPLNGRIGDIFSQLHIRAFEKLEQEAPGAWAIDEGDGTIQLSDHYTTERRNLLVELYQAIPVPNREIPLADILEFKNNRQDELLNLRGHIDELYQSLIKSEDTEHAVLSMTNKISRSCTDLVKVSREKRPIFAGLGSIKMTYNLPLGSVLATTVAGVASGGLFQVPLSVSAAIGGIAGFASGLNLSVDTGGLRIKDRDNPYNYVLTINRHFG